MKWIKHDTDANQDAKLQNVLLDYGLEGYGLYWYCIELIAGKVDKDSITFELEHDARIIARNTGSTAQKVEKMMQYFVEIGLFECSNNTISCMKLAKRLDKSMTSNPEMRTIIETLRGKSHDSIMTQSEKPMQDKIRIEENRIDKNKEKDTEQVQVVDQLFEYWIEMTGRTGKTIKSKKRIDKIKARLKDFTAREIAQAILNCSKDQWCIDTGNNTIEYICKSTEMVEKYLHRKS